MDKKKSLRHHIGTLKAGLSPAERRQKSRAICVILQKQIESNFPAGAKVLFFAGMADEPDLFPLFSALSRQNTFVGAFPRISDLATGQMEAIQVKKLSELQKDPAHFDLWEPQGDLIIAPQELDLVLVPAVAVDSSGNRLGRGGGFYDRFLSNLAPHCRKWAVVFSRQKVEKVLTGWHDIGVDAVIDECSFSPFSR